MKPAIIRSVVVLPHPEGPSSEKNSPPAMSRSRLSTTVSLAELLRQAAEAHRRVLGRLRPSRGWLGVGWWSWAFASGDEVQGGGLAVEQARHQQRQHDQEG